MGVMGDEKEGYGPTCNARFCLPEQVCALAPGHAGEHDALIRGSEEVRRDDLRSETFDLLHWARSRPAVLALLRVLKHGSITDEKIAQLRPWRRDGSVVLGSLPVDAVSAYPPVPGLTSVEVSEQPPVARRCELRGDLLENGVMRSVDECSCTFVQRRTDEPVYAEWYERRADAECEVHGGAEALTAPAAPPAMRPHDAEHRGTWAWVARAGEEECAVEGCILRADHVGLSPIIACAGPCAEGCALCTGGWR